MLFIITMAGVLVGTTDFRFKVINIKKLKFTNVDIL